MDDTTNTTFPCQDLLGAALEGNRYPGTWNVVEKLERKPDATGGNFSVGYIVEHDDGTRAFLKATDASFLWSTPAGDRLSEFSRIIQEQEFERTILDICRGNNMDRVVLALDHGEFEVVFENARSFVFYVVFELADGDIRTQAVTEKRFDYVWCFHALHNLAVAIGQLHRSLISHNDIKPSNLLVFGQRLQKLADVGRATTLQHAGPFDALSCPGDRTYAAPEQLYRWQGFADGEHGVSFASRQASDLYLLGSMAYFLATGQSLTPMIFVFMRSEHQPQNWAGSFEDVLPYWRNAFGMAMKMFDNATEIEGDDELKSALNKLRNAIYQLAEASQQLVQEQLSEDSGKSGDLYSPLLITTVDD